MNPEADFRKPLRAPFRSASSFGVDEVRLHQVCLSPSGGVRLHQVCLSPSGGVRLHQVRFLGGRISALPKANQNVVVDYWRPVWLVLGACLPYAWLEALGCW
ncbi:unnamed protein product [Polarella glacialis]|uniref:Uncharacterized protein n=1 Tax=Polarella glacialis TaxID=89957 RepID=A0A813IYL4_POLGL|nr:unnamed protein product [Polarella glacialis]